MNIKSIKNSTYDDIKSNSTLYRTVVEVMTYVDRKAPIGSCCGRNKESIINKFINNKEMYISVAEMGVNRTIKPLWSGPLFFSTAHAQINADYLTDEEMIYLIESGKVNKRYFDMSGYAPTQSDEVVDEVIINEEPSEETKVVKNKTTKRKKRNKK